MKSVINLSQVPNDYVDESPAMRTLMLGMAGGSQKLYANIDVVAPGAKSCKLHSHTHQEEFFLVLKGSGTLRFGDITRKVQQGDFFSKPAGQGLVHQFINDSDQLLEILDVGVPHPDDVVEYPEENVQLIKATRQFVRNGIALDGWTSDPNS